jgi:hypothetical protein
MVAEMDRLLENYNYADTARILNEKGFKTGDGLPVTPIAIGYVRKAYSLKTRFERLRERGLITLSEMARVCRVSTNTIGRWREKGLVHAHAVDGGKQCLFENPGSTPPNKGKRSLARACRARRLTAREYNCTITMKQCRCDFLD